MICKDCSVGAMERRKQRENRAIKRPQSPVRYMEFRKHIFKERAVHQMTSQLAQHSLMLITQADLETLGSWRSQQLMQVPHIQESRTHLEYSTQAGGKNRQIQGWHRFVASWDHPWCRVSFWDNENVLELDHSDYWTTSNIPESFTVRCSVLCYENFEKVEGSLCSRAEKTKDGTPGEAATLCHGFSRSLLACRPFLHTPCIPVSRGGPSQPTFPWKVVKSQSSLPASTATT